MLIKYPLITILPISTVCFVLWSGWSTLITAPITIPQGSILLSLAVAHRAEAFANIYERCYVHSGGYINVRNCAKVVRSELTLWGIGLTVLARLKDSLKQDEDSRLDSQANIKVGNQTMVHIKAFEIVSKRGDDSNIGDIKFVVDEKKFTYLNANITALKIGDSNLVKLGLAEKQEGDYMRSILIAEVNRNGTVNMLPMHPAPVKAQDGFIGDLYIHGAMSGIKEYQYGDSLSGVMYGDIGN